MNNMTQKLILYPAIDLKGGQCVRLKQGDMDQATVFNTDPADQARQFAEAGGIEKGTVVFATIAERETLKGAFRGESGRDLLIESDGKTERVPADSINELAAVIDAHAHRNAGMAIGLAIDLAVGAGAAWLWHERESHIVR